MKRVGIFFALLIIAVMALGVPGGCETRPPVLIDGTCVRVQPINIYYTIERTGETGSFRVSNIWLEDKGMFLLDAENDILPGDFIRLLVTDEKPILSEELYFRHFGSWESFTVEPKLCFLGQYIKYWQIIQKGGGDSPPFLLPKIGFGNEALIEPPFKQRY